METVNLSIMIVNVYLEHKFLFPFPGNLKDDKHIINVVCIAYLQCHVCVHSMHIKKSIY